jgi:ribonuclease BN (tRNA processing enzyme)
MPSLTLLGSGEAFDPVLPNTSLLYQGERNVLVDCGFAAAQAMWRHSLAPEFLDAVLLTHHHADHTFGLPALLMVMQAGGRARPLTIIGPPGTKQYVATLFDLAYTPGLVRLTFEVDFVECALGESVTCGPIAIRTALPDHGIPVLSTRWEAGGAPQFAYSADGKATEATRALFKGVPVLVHECYAMPGREGPVHSNVETVLEAAAESGAGTLILVHQAAPQRALIADFVRAQTIFAGQVLMPEGVVRVRVG